MQFLKFAIPAAMSALVLVSPVALAQEDSASADEAGPPSMRGMSVEERQAAFAALSEEEQQAVRKRQRAAREKQRAEWQKMTPEERDVRRAELQALLEQMTPEQREAIRERRERRQNASQNRDSGPRTQPQEEKEPES